MNAFETIIFEKTGRIGRITLNRPSVLNVYNVRMRDELYEALETVRIDGEIHVLLLQGAGEKAFCAGADLSEFLTAPSPTIARHVRWCRDVWGLFLSLPQPVIAALHGYVMGSGIEIAMCCDIRIAATDCIFALPEVSLGIIPAAGATQTVPRAIGLGRSMDILLSGRRFGAKEALEMRLVNRIVPHHRLKAVAEAVARRIAAKNPQVVRAIKQAVVRGLDLSLTEGLQMEKNLYLRLTGSKQSNR